MAPSKKGDLPVEKAWDVVEGVSRDCPHSVVSLYVTTGPSLLIEFTSSSVVVSNKGGDAGQTS